MSWIKEANKIGKYYTTYEGFRIYITKPGRMDERIEERKDGIWKVTDIIKPHYVAIDKNGLRLFGEGSEAIAWEIDKEILNRRFAS